MVCCLGILQPLAIRLSFFALDHLWVDYCSELISHARGSIHALMSQTLQHLSNMLFTCCWNTEAQTL